MESSSIKMMELIQEADRSKWMMHSVHSIRCFTQGDIERMTNNYRTSLGRGGFGEVYEGVLEDESMVAVKRLFGNVKEKFAKEFIIHREINHKNVVRLIGYCVEENALVLVMEYIANGNLSDVLHDNNCPIPLDIRLRIAIECAEALAYMHSHMYTQVIHGDIKPGNILLDSNFHAKLSDFGISRLANTDKTLRTENVIGSIGYMDPLFSLDGHVTVKYDVYSFGVVLIELITRRKAVVDSVNNVCAFNNAFTRGVRGVREMFDGDIASKSNMKVLEGVAKLAGECLRMDRDKRPEMMDVAERLRVLWKSQGRQRVHLFSWVRKSNPAPPPSVNIPANIFPSDVYRQFSFAEIKVATNNFDKSRFLGWDVNLYKGVLEGNIEVAIQKFTVIVERSKKEYSKIMLMLSQINHKNIVKLLGSCLEKEVPLLVLEFFPNKLFELIHANQCRHISLATRLQIAYESAEALSYLHYCASPPIIHGDVKSSNILIDSDYTVKVYNFGASILAPTDDEAQFVTTAQGTLGYLDPEYYQTCQLTEKSDVYSFGVVLLELLTRKRAFNHDGPVSERSLAANFMVALSEERLEEILDDEIKNDENMEVLEEMAELAKRCLEICGAKRPSMKEVSVTLDRLRQVTQHRSTQHSLERTEFLLGELSMA